MRELKFRCFYRGEMYPVDELHFSPDGSFSVGSIKMDLEGLGIRSVSPDSEHIEGIMQYVGLKDKNGVDIYEGDIFRIEEDGNGIDDEDRMFYIVIVWVKEWAMFCSLLMEQEYKEYLSVGIKALDEPMFWTYTLEDTNSRKHYLCGNIYQHKHLLK